MSTAKEGAKIKFDEMAVLSALHFCLELEFTLPPGVLSFMFFWKSRGIFFFPHGCGRASGEVRGLYL